ncbi:MAG: FG-GAP-like repeat-containing protein [Planctomycetota bacterium]
MSPQFVDLDADGHLDIVAGIFDGSPHVAFGDGKHWRQPEQILDKEGQRIVMNAWWNFDKKQWDKTHRCDAEGAPELEGHLTSAWAYDWDHDGDLDLLLGDHTSGQVLLRVNEGSATKPAFATRNTVVTAAGEPLVVPGTVTTLRTIDWNGDGRDDLLVGSMGDAYSGGEGGGVLVYLDTATEGAPTTLIERSHKGADQATRPDSGLYMDAVDHDGDGDLDLVVGGYAHWTPAAPALDEAQQQRLNELRERVGVLTTRIQELNAEMLAAQEGLDAEAARQKRMEMAKDPAREKVFAERAEAVAEIEKLSPGMKRESFVWLYENVGGGKVGGGH